MSVTASYGEQELCSCVCTYYVWVVGSLYDTAVDLFTLLKDIFD